ncbi:hypothetical protein BH23GEM9_BH23GEM9_28500 [soil metagenome]
MKHIQRSLLRAGTMMAVAFVAACSVETAGDAAPAAELPAAEVPSAENRAREMPGLSPHNHYRPPSGRNAPWDGSDLDLPAAPLFEDRAVPERRPRRAPPPRMRQA